MPTSLELAGVPRPAHVRFNSLMPLVRGEAFTPFGAIYGAYLQLQRMVTCDGFKLILYPKARQMRLYDLRQDLQEMHDLAGQSDQRDRIRRLFRRLKELQLETADTLDLTEFFPGL